MIEANAQQEPPIWEVLIVMGEEIPDEELSGLPTDLSKNLDKYLYGDLCDGTLE